MREGCDQVALAHGEESSEVLNIFRWVSKAIIEASVHLKQL
jgi:hypothetical protein